MEMIQKLRRILDDYIRLRVFFDASFYQVDQRKRICIFAGSVPKCGRNSDFRNLYKKRTAPMVRIQTGAVIFIWAIDCRLFGACDVFLCFKAGKCR